MSFKEAILQQEKIDVQGAAEVGESEENSFQCLGTSSISTSLAYCVQFPVLFCFKVGVYVCVCVIKYISFS